LYDARSFPQRCDYTQRGNGSYRPAISPVFQAHPRRKRPHTLPDGQSLFVEALA